MSTLGKRTTPHPLRKEVLECDIPSQKAYDGTLSVVRALFSLYNITIEGREQVPDPPFILASTHRGFRDIIALGITFRDIGRVQYMAKEELFKNGLIGRHLLRTGTFPINRENPKPEQLDRAFSVLKAPEDNILGIFPEGSIKSGPEVEMPKSSFAIMALASQVPIVVAAVAGPERRPKSIAPSDLHVHVGGVIDLSGHTSPYDPDMGLMRYGASNKQIVREISAETRALMESSLAEAQASFSPHGTSIRYLDNILYPAYS